jgi:membrane protein DedA with SNARE-associated domain
MTDWFIAALVDYGVFLLGVATFFSCLAVPIPTSLMMLTGGAFVATGDLNLIQTASAAFIGAILGDQAGFQIGARGKFRLRCFMSRNTKRAHLMQRADSYLHKWGGIGVFLSRWLFSPLGPYVNFASGAAELNWLRFSLASFLGEIAWVSIYIGLGYGFADNLTMASELASSVMGLLAAVTLMIGFGLWIYRYNRRRTLGLAIDAP